MMKIAITSANGQLGRAIIKQSIKEFGKDNVIGLARTPSKAEDLGIEIRKGDYDNKNHFEISLAGIEVLVIISGNGDPVKRVEQHRNIIKGAILNGVRKIVYTSIVGEPGKSSFDGVLNSNRQTEKDILDSGLDYSIGRNGLYLEPDIEYIPNYIKEGGIMNSAGEGRCSYCTRDEVAIAYVQLIKNDELNGKFYNLTGASITQQQLCDLINKVYGTDLTYKALTVDEYKRDRVAAYDEFFGSIISGIYEAIRNGSFDLKSDFELVVGHPHVDFEKYMRETK